MMTRFCLFLKLAVFFIVASLCLSASTAKEKFHFVGMYEYPPFNSFKEVNGKKKLVGLDIELITAAAEKAGVDIEIELVPWPRALLMAKQGKADGIFNAGWVNNREEFLYYPKTPLRQAKFTFFVNKHFKGTIKRLEDVKGLEIGIIREYYICKELIEDEKIKKMQANNAEQLFMQLNENRVSVAVHSRIAGMYTLNKLGLNEIRTFPYTDAPPHASYLAFSKASPKGKLALEIFSKAIKEIEQNGTMQRIRKKYGAY